MTPEKWKAREADRRLKALGYEKRGWIQGPDPFAAQRAEMRQQQREMERRWERGRVEQEKAWAEHRKYVEQERARNQSIRDCFEGYNEYTGLLEAQDLIAELEGKR